MERVSFLALTKFNGMCESELLLSESESTRGSSSILAILFFANRSINWSVHMMSRSLESLRKYKSIKIEKYFSF